MPIDRVARIESKEDLVSMLLANRNTIAAMLSASMLMLAMIGCDEIGQPRAPSSDSVPAWMHGKWVGQIDNQELVFVIDADHIQAASAHWNGTLEDIVSQWKDDHADAEVSLMKESSDGSYTVTIEVRYATRRPGQIDIDEVWTFIHLDAVTMRFSAEILYYSDYTVSPTIAGAILHKK